jgi:hypothetical protein
VAICFGQNSRPSSYEQYWLWIKQALPGGDKFYMLGLAAICWALWKTCNDIYFGKKPLKTPFNVFFHACALLHYWVGLHIEKAQQLIKGGGVDVMLKTTTHLMGAQAPSI